MKQKWKRRLAQLLTTVMAMGMLQTAAFAQEENLGGAAAKTAQLLDRAENRYQIDVQVPGEDGVSRHDEVVVMVDGSYSGDNEWPNTRAAILEIGDTVLNGSGSTQLTLMTFGMADNIVIEHIKSSEELNSKLPSLPGGLLYGRSSTNCEAGFTGIGEYIDTHDATLNDVYVIYITDGEINTDETPHAFYSWRENTWLRYSAEEIALKSLGYECDAILAGAEKSNAYGTVFGADAEPATVKATATAETALQWAAQVWADVYAEAGMVPEEAYPVSEAELAFVSYDDKHDTYVQDAFYYALVGRGYPDRWTRTPAAATALAAKEEVAHLYMVDTNGATEWMNLESVNGVSGENVSFTYNAEVTGLTEALRGALQELSKTPYNDVRVTDYTSKWVNFIPGTVKLYDDQKNILIYDESNGGWQIPAEERPTAEEVPVVVEKVPAEGYEAGGSDVIGNCSGDIYKLTWKIKDGALLRSDQYRLTYEVTVDTAESGFQYNTNLPANGITTVTYTDADGTEKTERIDVPVVEVPKTSSGSSSSGGGDDTITIKVIKKWSGDTEAERPEEVKVVLLKDGEATGRKATLNEANDWTYKWNRLDEDYDWSVEEVDIPEGYTAEVKQKGNTFTITNEKEEPEEELVILPNEPEGPDAPASPVVPDASVEEKAPVPHLPEEDVFLNDIPKTGENGYTGAGLFTAAMTLGVLCLITRKKKET